MCTHPAEAPSGLSLLQAGSLSMHLKVHPYRGKDRILMHCKPFLLVVEDTQD